MSHQHAGRVYMYVCCMEFMFSMIYKTRIEDILQLGQCFERAITVSLAFEF